MDCPPITEIVEGECVDRGAELAYSWGVGEVHVSLLCIT